ncbi:MAG TPA: sigma factor-like helix-turn-helix DNA-binding protein [Solirubrobacteraceae bacterium]|nr:sigma factor-like helix-turn-helix DNA-binding protein [Solirubrobacteraceae bacterium]
MADERHTTHLGTEVVVLEMLLDRGRWMTTTELLAALDDVDPDSIEIAIRDLEWENVVKWGGGERLRVTRCAVHVNKLVGTVVQESLPDPHTESAEFVARVEVLRARGESVTGRPVSDRSMEMLRLRLIDGLTFREIGDRYGIGASRVPQLLTTYFGIRGTPPAAKARPRKPRGATGRKP